MQFYVISFMHPYKQPGQSQDVIGTLCWLLLHRYITMQGSKKTQIFNVYCQKLLSTEKMQVVSMSTESWGQKGK